MTCIAAHVARDERLVSVKRHALVMAHYRKVRDDAIRQAKAEGATLREIAVLAGLSAMGVKKILDRSP